MKTRQAPLSVSDQGELGIIETRLLRHQKSTVHVPVYRLAARLDFAGFLFADGKVLTHHQYYHTSTTGRPPPGSIEKGPLAGVKKIETATHVLFVDEEQ